MCGLVGYVDLEHAGRGDARLLARMASTLVHRGPDSFGTYVGTHAGLGFRRLSILDLERGDQPIYNEDGTIVLVCNGEIYEYEELRRELRSLGHTFRSNTDVEVLVHLYEEKGVGLLEGLNGQFAFALYDSKEDFLLLARDQFGIAPLHYTVVDGQLLFASEIKALLRSPAIRPEVDLTGLDQVLCFPGLISPRTMFKGIRSLPAGHYLSVRGAQVTSHQYWDLDYPLADEAVEPRSESESVEALSSLLQESLRRRLQADVPVGFYLSGGLDSSLIAAMLARIEPGRSWKTFSIDFPDDSRSESRFRELVTSHVGSDHREIVFRLHDVADRLPRSIYHAECPIKETYNTCSLALSSEASSAGLKVILTGEGADELFAGYPGYKFDRFHSRRRSEADLEAILEGDLREKIWGDRDFFYESDQLAFRGVREALYSTAVASQLVEFDCLDHPVVDRSKLCGRDVLHMRSYVDFKLRMADHLLGDHGDRMALANSLEARYPFLDLDLVEFAAGLPPRLKLRGYTEKFLLRRLADPLLPREIAWREKFGWHAPASPELLQGGIEWVHDMLSSDRIRRQGYFDARVVESLKDRYCEPGFRLNLPFESDLLMIVITFGLFKDCFGLPDFS